MKDPKTYFEKMDILKSEFWLGYLAAAAGWMASFLTPLAPFLIFTAFLVVADLVTGIKAARRQRHKITSTGLKRTTEKLLVYFIAMLAAEGMSYVFMPQMPVAYLVAFTIAVTEFKSILENVEVVTGVSIWQAIKDKVLNSQKPKK